jgi:hypothetical protein
MRNDARPIGHDLPQDPVPASDAPGTLRAPHAGEDARESVTHDRQSHVVNRGAAENAPRGDADLDPVMPVDDSTLNTKI